MFSSNRLSLLTLKFKYGFRQLSTQYKLWWPELQSMCRLTAWDNRDVSFTRLMATIEPPVLLQSLTNLFQVQLLLPLILKF